MLDIYKDTWEVLLYRTIDFERENVCFSASFEIKTVLLDLRNQIKNVFNK
jgi:hypothetical protein